MEIKINPYLFETFLLEIFLIACFFNNIKMESARVQEIAEECCQGFSVSIGSIQYRQKKSILSIRKRGQRLTLILNTQFQKFEEEIIRAFLYTSIAKITHQINSPKYLFYKQEIKKYRETGYFRQFQSLQNKILGNPIGKVYNLVQISSDILLEFRGVFGNYFDSSTLKFGWTQRGTFRRMGYYDSLRNTIAISKSLDTTEVPLYVIKYVIYHELLHAFLGFKKTKKKNNAHHTNFKELEKYFPENEKANLFLSQFCQKIKNKSNKMY